MSNPTSGSTPRKRGPLGGRSPVRGPVEKAKDFKGSMKKLLQYLGKYKFRIFLVMGTAMQPRKFSMELWERLPVQEQELILGVSHRSFFSCWDCISSA